MAGYVTIPDSDLDPESPVTTSLMTALRDNPIAITEKAVGAPVLANGYVVAAMMAEKSVGVVNLADAVIGNYSEFEWQGTSNASIALSKIAECRVVRDGDYRVKTIGADNFGFSNITSFQIYINGSPVGVAHEEGSYFEDFTGLSAGDLIQLWGKSLSSSGIVSIKMRVLSGNPVVPGEVVT